MEKWVPTFGFSKEGWHNFPDESLIFIFTVQEIKDTFASVATWLRHPVRHHAAAGRGSMAAASEASPRGYKGLCQCGAFDQRM